MTTIDLKGQALNLTELMNSTASKTQMFYISVVDELVFMQAVHKLVLEMSFMIQMRKTGEYCFNYYGKRYTVCVDLNLTEGQLQCEGLSINNFRGVTHTFFAYYGDLEPRVELPIL